jgi:hypothetical protein
VTTLGHLIFIRNKIMGKARDLARLSPNSSGQLPDANLLALAANKLSGVIPDANAPSGSVIQVVSTTKTDTFSTTSGSYTSITGLTASITPISTTSRILVLCKLVVGWDTSVTKVYACTARNGTPIDLGVGSGRVQAGFEQYGTDPYHAFVGHLQFLDSPATTSTVVYSPQIRTQGSGTVYCNRSHGYRASAPEYDGTLSSTITVMEISA